MAIWDWECKRDVLPFAAMAVVECTTVGLHTLYKAAALKGLECFVYFTYSYVFGTLLLLLISFLFPRSGLPSFDLSLLYRFILLSVTSFLAWISGFKGLEYSSPALSSAIGTLTPAFTFIVAVIFRMENLNLRSSSTHAKIIGTVVSALGALIAVLYKGPKIPLSPLTRTPSQSLHFSLQKSETNWALGGLLLVADKLLTSSSFVLQAHILNMYCPNELFVSFIKCLFITIITVPVSFLAERDLSTWSLRPDITLITVIFSVFFGPTFITSIHSFCLPVKGPLYVAIFAPFTIVLAAAFSVVFLGEALHLGSVVGAAILLLGFYAVLWGKSKEEKSQDCRFDNLGASPNYEKTPLLQNYRDEKYDE